MSNANSAIVVARLLGTEGFTPHTASQVKRYALRGATSLQTKRYRDVKREFGEIMARLTKGERMIVGAYIRILKGMSFDTALKIGLTAHAVDCEERRVADRPSP